MKTRGRRSRRIAADPVMLADVHLRNRVTRDEFMTYANANFAALDVNRDGRLSRAEILHDMHAVVTAARCDCALGKRTYTRLRSSPVRGRHHARQRSP